MNSCHLFILSQLLIANAQDETCLLQTKVSAQTRQGGKDDEFEEIGDLKLGDKVPVFEIDLDQPPEKRFQEVAKHFKPEFLKFYRAFANNSAAFKVQQMSTQFRGPEDPEAMAEMGGVAEVLGVPVMHIQSHQLHGPFQPMKGPYFTMLNAQGKTLPTEERLLKLMLDPKLLKKMPSVGCTGILAKDSKDGSVWHARNLDVGFAHWLQPMTYNAIFKKGGAELYTANVVFPSQQILTGIRRGPNGYAYEYNTRFNDNMMDTQALMANLFFQKRPLSSWTIRKGFESNNTYESFLETVSKTPFPNKEYAIVSGVKKGAVIARDPEGIAYTMEIDDKNPFIVMTNFDYKIKDPKEWIPKYREEGVSQRVRVQKMLKGKQITPELLKKVLADQDVMADGTIYSSLINVEHNSFQSSLPNCNKCHCDSDDGEGCDDDGVSRGFIS
jgi:hypothetical protein